MTPAEHYEAAEKILNAIKASQDLLDASWMQANATEALVHATLALYSGPTKSDTYPYTKNDAKLLASLVEEEVWDASE